MTRITVTPTKEKKSIFCQIADLKSERSSDKREIVTHSIIGVQLQILRLQLGLGLTSMISVVKSGPSMSARDLRAPSFFGLPAASEQMRQGDYH